MEFYWNKLKDFRKEKHFSINYIISKMGISRSTYWLWETGRRCPEEINIRILSKILNVSVSTISDLKPEISITNKNTKEIASIINKQISPIHDNIDTIFSMVINTMSELKNKVMGYSTLLKAMTSSVNTMYYIKDIELKYITVNDLFLKKLSFSADFVCTGVTDETFFSKEEALINTKEDENVLISGNPLINKEGFIPGTRKKEWGLISKYPLIDSDNCVYGIVGTFIDITNRKRTEERREILEKAINAMSPSVTIYDCKKDKMIFLSEERIKILTGYPAEYFLKSPDFYRNNVLVPEDSIAFKKEFTFDKGVKKREFQFRIKNAKGEICVHNAIESYINISGKDYIVGVTTDITKDNGIGERFKLLEEFLNSEPYIIGLVDLNIDKYVFLSNNIKELTGYSVKDFFYAKNVSEILSIIFNMEDFQKYEQLIAGLDDISESAHCDLYIKGISGNQHKIRLVCKKQKITGKVILVQKISKL